MIQQLRDPILTEAEGFWSGPPTERGTFQFQFNEPGTYYYWSGFIEPSNVVHFRGVVVVKDEKEIKNLELQVTQNEIPALKCVFPFIYNGTSYTSCTNQDETFNWCSSSFDADNELFRIPCDPIEADTPPSCSTQQISNSPCGDNLDSIYTMRFTDCEVPTILTVSPLDINYDQNITINGTQFSETICENNVTVGGKPCEVLSASQTEIVCRLGKGSGLKPNQKYPIEVKVNNKGYALKAQNYLLVNFQSVAISVNPTIGSSQGGAYVSIKGDGFDVHTRMMIGELIYDSSNASIDYNSFNFTTIPNTQTYNLSVIRDGIESLYENVLSYEFLSDVNPRIVNISASEISEQTNLTIHGANFGSNKDELTIKIGNQICSVLELDDSNIVCSLQGLDIGTFLVELNVKTVGDCDPFSGRLTGLATISSIWPSSGSTNGGNIVRIGGNGFSSLSQVKIGTSNCSVQSVKIDEIVCETSAHAASTLSVSVITLGIRHENTTLVDYTFDPEKTPVIHEIFPVEENHPQSELTLFGEKFGDKLNEVHVKIGNASCEVTWSNDSVIICTLGVQGAGIYPIELKIDSYGLANKNVNFKYALNIHELSSQEGSLAGGLHLKISGSGFAKTSRVTICGNECKHLNHTSSEMFCVVPPTNSTTDKSCNLTVTENGMSASAVFNYSLALTSVVQNISRTRGGTGGGSIITIYGDNFS